MKVKSFQGFSAATNKITLWRNTKVPIDSQYFTLKEGDDDDGNLGDGNNSKQILLFYRVELRDHYTNQVSN